MIGAIFDEQAVDSRAQLAQSVFSVGERNRLHWIEHGDVDIELIEFAGLQGLKAGVAKGGVAGTGGDFLDQWLRGLHAADAAAQSSPDFEGYEASSVGTQVRRKVCGLNSKFGSMPEFMRNRCPCQLQQLLLFCLRVFVFHDPGLLTVP